MSRDTPSGRAVTIWRPLNKLKKTLSIWRRYGNSVISRAPLRIISIGGLGHLAIQFAAKMGYIVVAISRGSEKKDYALELGVRRVDSATRLFSRKRTRFDFLLCVNHNPKLRQKLTGIISQLVVEVLLGTPVTHSQSDFLHIITLR